MSLGRNILTILFSRVTVQIIAFASVPILTRIFDPRDFGIRQVFSSIFAVFAVICCLRYELSIPLGKNKSEAASSFLLSIFSTGLLCLLLFSILPMLKTNVARWYKMPELENFLWLLPLFLLAEGFGTSLKYWAGYENKFKVMAWASVASALSNQPLSLFWALTFGASLTALFLGHFFQIFMAALIFGVFLGPKLYSIIKSNNIDSTSILSTAKRHRKFPVLNSWSSLINSVSLQLPVFILGLYFPKDQIGYSVLGYYFLARSVISLPLQLVSQSISQVFYPTAAIEFNKNGTLGDIVSKVYMQLVHIGIFPVMLLIIFGEEIFRFLFGQEWSEAGIYVQILSPWLLFNFIGSPIGVFNILNRQGTGLFFTATALLLRTTALFIGSLYFSPRIALGLFSGVSALLSLTSVIFKLRLSNVSIIWAGAIILKHVFVCGIIIIPIKSLTYFYSSEWIILPAASFMSMFYAAFLLKTDSSIRRFLFSILPTGIYKNRSSGAHK